MVDPMPVEPAAQKESTDDKLDKIIRRQDSLQNTMDLLYKDRELLEDIHTRLGMLTEALVSNKKHQTQVDENIKQEVASVKVVIEDKTVIIKASEKSILERIWNAVRKIKK